MAFVPVQCPQCHRTEVGQYGKQAQGMQRYRCDNPDCPRPIFLSLQAHEHGHDRHEPLLHCGQEVDRLHEHLLQLWRGAAEFRLG